MFFDVTGFYVMLGVGLLLAGLVGLLKLGLWFWVMTRVFHRPGSVAAEPARPTSSPANSLKTWLGIVATALGIVTTSIGIMKECAPSSSSSAPAGPSYTPSMPSMGSYCCTPAGACVLMMAAAQGSACTCFDMMGNVAMGQVCIEE